jgi:glycosyltransferase involved in cell wall biosynthesis
MSLSVAVVTSTQGRSTITRAIKSVQDQTRKATHYVFIHGADYSYKTISYLEDDTVAVHLPHNNGGNGYAMAPVYALAPFVIKEDIIFYLDDDNWYEPDHIESLVTIIQDHDLGWAYSLRKIVDNNGDWICDDNCESLGCHPNSHGHYLVDNSCYAVRTNVARKHGHAWYVPIISDRNFQAALMRNKVKSGTTGRHTVNYRLSHDGSGGMGREQFISNNEWMKLNRPGFEWAKKQIFNF